MHDESLPKEGGKTRQVMQAKKVLINIVDILDLAPWRQQVPLEIDATPNKV
jgi:hypothetical protein